MKTKLISGWTDNEKGKPVDFEATVKITGVGIHHEKISGLIEAAPELLIIAKHYEWSAWGDGEWHCPACGGVSTKGHISTCAVGLGILKAEGGAK